MIKENKLLKVKTAQNSIGVMSLPISVNIIQSKNTTKPSVYTMGKKHYESTDWLGNVRVTYTDKKSWQQNKFALNVSSSQDYYPFGATMEGRKYNLTAYRYAFNTQERVPELNESHYTSLYWEYDGRLARRWNRDPKPMVYISDYSVLSNNPLKNIDYLGDRLEGATQEDAQKAKQEIFNSLNPTKDISIEAMLEKFFTLDESGKSFKNISQLEFNQWLYGKGKYRGKGSGFSKEQIALANGYMKVINASKKIIVKFDDTFPGGQLDVSDDEQSAVATIGGKMVEFAGTNGPLKSTPTSIFVHEVVGEGMAFLQYGDLRKYQAEYKEKLFQNNNNFNTTPMLPEYRQALLQIIQTENLYWKIIGFTNLRLGIGGEHYVHPDDASKVGLLPINLMSSFSEQPYIIRRSSHE